MLMMLAITMMIRTDKDNENDYDDSDYDNADKIGFWSG